MQTNRASVLQEITTKGELDDELRQKLNDSIKEFKALFEEEKAT